MRDASKFAAGIRARVGQGRRFSVVASRAALLVGLAIVLPIQSADAQRRAVDPTQAGELGYVTNDGLVLRPHPAFSSAARAVSGASNRSQSDWRTCMSGNDFRRAFSMPRNEFVRYQRNPAQFCGPQPSGVDTSTAEEFQIREFVFSISDGRRMGGVVATVTFNDAGDMLVPNSERLAGKCLVLTNSAGAPIPVRSDRGRDPYSFSNPFQKVADPVGLAQTQAQRLSSEMALLQSRVSESQGQLSASNAYRGGQCIRPATRPIPTRPAVMSDAAITTAAKGFCTDMSMRRHPVSDVRAALRSAYMDDYDAARAAWVRGPQAQCAVNVRSQTDDQFTRWMGQLGPQFGYYGMIQDQIKTCEAIATRSCRAPLAAWESQAAAIRAGPAAELSQCQALVSQVTTSEASMRSVAPRLEQARADLIAAQNAPQQQAQSLPLSQATCGSTGSNSGDPVG